MNGKPVQTDGVVIEDAQFAIRKGNTMKKLDNETIKKACLEYDKARDAFLEKKFSGMPEHQFSQNFCEKRKSLFQIM